MDFFFFQIQVLMTGYVTYAVKTVKPLEETVISDTGLHK